MDKKILEFLNEFRVLECSCCGQVFGFQDKASGRLFCIGGCHENKHDASGGAPVMALMNGLMSHNALAGLNLSAPGSSPKPELSSGSAFKTTNPLLISKTKVMPNVEEIVKSTPKVEKPQEAVRKVAPAPLGDAVDGSQRAVEKKAAAVPTPIAQAKAVSKPDRPLWTSCKYSKSIENGDAVKVQFMWNSTTYQIVSEKDEAALEQFQAMISTYAATAKPLNRAPVEDEMVIGKYEGEYYRARVTKVSNDKCEISFVDYGDKTVCTFGELFPVNDEIMKVPVYGVTVHLDKLSPELSYKKLGAKVEEDIYGNAWMLDLCNLKELRNPGDQEVYEVRLWESRMENTINEVVLLALSRGWTALTPEEKWEINYLTETHEWLRQTKVLVEEAMLADSVRRGDVVNAYVFKLDNTDYPYRMIDLPLIPSQNAAGILNVEVTKYEKLDLVTVRPCGPVFSKMQADMSDRIKVWINAKHLSRKAKGKPELAPEAALQMPKYNEIYLVKWPSWEEVNYDMEFIMGKDWSKSYMDDHQLHIFSEDYEAHEGKWFRAAFKWAYTYYKDEKNSVFEMFMVDIGKTTLIPFKHVYKIPHRLMLDFQMSLFVSVQLESLKQLSEEVEEKWKVLLLPGLKLQVKVVWMFEHINIVTLVNPTEDEFEKHFLHPYTQEKIRQWKALIQSHEHQKKAKKQSKGKKGYQIHLEKIINEDAATKEKLEQFKEMYSGIGRVSFEQILELKDPRPPPPEAHTNNGM